LFTNVCAENRNFKSTFTARAVAGLRLLVVTAFVGSANADDVVFGSVCRRLRIPD
jgi:hypothetical protein